MNRMGSTCCRRSIRSCARCGCRRTTSSRRRSPRGALLRLRLPALDDVAYEALARSLRDGVTAAGLRLVVDRDEAMARRIGAAGIHYAQARLQTAPARTGTDDGLLRLASCHDADSIAQAGQLGFDGVVLGPVQQTASHPGATTLGWDGLAALAGPARLPVYAIGGLGPQDKRAAFEHYAQGVAGISAYWSRSGS